MTALFFTLPVTSMMVRFLLLCLMPFLVGCKTDHSHALFTALPAEKSGLAFNNEIARYENDSLNVLTYDYIYHGGGVGIGDFNRDGRPDLFFSGNAVSSRLYLNSGDWTFRDVTRSSGVTTRNWCTGVSVVDINQDGWSDIYVCVAGLSTPEGRVRHGHNLLFVNQGVPSGGDSIPVFREMAADYGLADNRFSMQAAFFDADRDGDLDCFVLGNSVEATGRNVIRPKRVRGEGPSTSRLYRQESTASGHPFFRDVSAEAGITVEGYGLGLCITDLNDDGWPDIYGANDFVSNDLVWINNRRGGFTDQAAALFQHTAFNSMGVDIQDVNNDGRPEVTVTDMLPENNRRQKLMLIKTSWDYFRLARQAGYQDEYVRNVLQLNLGKIQNSNQQKKPPGGSVPNGFESSLPQFAEIGQLSGIARTDWSWGPLLADFDLDSYRDLLVTNGYRRDLTNLDYIMYLNEGIAINGLSAEAFRRESNQRLKNLPETKIHSYLFRNRGDLTFEDKSLAWGLGEEAYSNGAAYADLDNDGDLDLVINRIDGAAGLYRNETRRADQNSESHFLRIKLAAPSPNREGLGARVRLELSNGQILVQEGYPVRGYLSSMDPTLHFGLGRAAVRSGEIRWPDGKVQTLTGLQPDRTYTVSYRPDDRPGPPPPTGPAPFFDTLDGAALGLDYRHEETEFNDFLRTPLLPRQFSKNSPGMAVGDANGDGLDDLFIGTDPGRTRSVYLQRPDGRFTAQVQGANDLEDMGALFLDADGDGDQDLYVVSGSSMHDGDSPYYQDRLYRNDGTGKLVRSPESLPTITSSGGCVVAADFDHDGDPDLFRGGRIQPGQYPSIPKSYLLRNEGGGRFTDVTDVLAPGLRRVGMVCAALWTDVDNDTWPDLLLAGEWMPLTLVRNQSGRLRPTAGKPESTGWWNSLAGGDFDRDGDTDYLAGNLGLNSRYQATAGRPVRLYAHDFDNNGKIDPILTYYLEGEEQLAPIRDVLTDQIPSIKKVFPSYTAYAKGSLADAFEEDLLKKATKLTAFELRSCYVENLGGGAFRLRPLQVRAQMSPVFGIQVDDFNGDGHPDALLVGNSYATETYAGWYDAGRGCLLTGDGKGLFAAVEPHRSGVNAGLDAKGLARLETRHGPLFVVSNNNGPIQLIRPLGRSGEPAVQLPVRASYALVTHADGRRQRIEFYRGSGYLSASSPQWRPPVGAKAWQLFDESGRLLPKPGSVRN